MISILLGSMVLSGCAGDDCLFVPGGTHKDYSTGQPGQQMPGRVIGKCKGPELPAYDPYAEARRNAPLAESNAYGGKPRHKVDLASAYEHGGFYDFQSSNILQTSTIKAWIPKDPKKAEYWYRLALKEKKDVTSSTYEKAYEGLIRLGADMSSLPEPHEWRRQQRQEELKEETKLAEAGDPKAAFLVGLRYSSSNSKGEARKENDRKAADWFAKAAAKGHITASVLLGFLYVEGRLGEEGKYEKALPLFEQAAERPSKVKEDDYSLGVSRKKARYQLGKMYLNGWGAPKDEKRGVALLKAAAESKSTDAQTTLAHLYETGTAVEQSNEQAAAWYFKAADGVYQAQYKNRPDYDRRLFSKDHKNMILWFRKASDLGHEQATSRLAEMYENGHIEIGKKDKAKAIELYRKAASQGDAEAVTALKRLGAGI